jgi:DNA repair protein SbcC/Rad50
MSPRLHSVTITDFRSIRGNINVPLDAPVVLIHGPNGAGKTSILSAIELALTGAIPSLGRVESDYTAYLVHKEATQAQVKLRVEGLSQAPPETTFTVTSGGALRGKPLLPERLANFFSERCYLPQSALGRLLELYQASDARDSDSPLTVFVKDLLGLDVLDALIDGLFDAGDVRRLRGPVPQYQELRDEIGNLESTLQGEDAELTELRKQIEESEQQLRETLSVVDANLVQEPIDLQALSRRLDRNAEEERLAALARVRRNVDAAHREWKAISVPTAAEQRRTLERDAELARVKADEWRASSGRDLEILVDQVSNLFPDLPSPMETDPEFARTTALRSVTKELVRCTTLLIQDEADTKQLAQLNQNLSRARARSIRLDQQIAGLADDSGLVAQALAGIVPHIHTEDCPVCGRDFSEISKRPLSAFVSARIAELTQHAGRLQALSIEKSAATTTIFQIDRDRAGIEGRQISNTTRNELKERRSTLEELKIKLETLSTKTQEGLALVTQANQAARSLDALRSRDLRINNFRDTLRNIAVELDIQKLDPGDSIEATLDFFGRTLSQEEVRLTDSQRRRQRASSDLAIVVSLRARYSQLQRGVAAKRSRLSKISDAKGFADERIVAARELSRRAREVRTSVVRRVFNDALNSVWRDLFVRLAPEEPFVPAFALPSTSVGPVEAVLETIYRKGGRGGNPRAMLSAGNLNTAALTLFLSLHLSVDQELPFLVIDDPVQSMDEVHIAQFVALLRTLSKSHGRQVILAVHERSLFEYLALELSPAFSDDRLTTIELGQAPDGTAICKFEPLTWKPDPAIAAA